MECRNTLPLTTTVMYTITSDALVRSGIEATDSRVVAPPAIECWWPATTRRLSGLFATGPGLPVSLSTTAIRVGQFAPGPHLAPPRASDRLSTVCNLSAAVSATMFRRARCGLAALAELEWHHRGQPSVPALSGKAGRRLSRCTPDISVFGLSRSGRGRNPGGKVTRVVCDRGAGGWTRQRTSWSLGSTLGAAYGRGG